MINVLIEVSVQSIQMYGERTLNKRENREPINNQMNYVPVVLCTNIFNEFPRSQRWADIMQNTETV